MAERVTDAAGILPDELAQEAESFLGSLPNGDFLPDVDRLIKAVNQGRGTARDNVLELRKEVSSLRTDLACALADRRIARGDFAGAARFLEPLAKQTPREDLVERLINAYTRTGQLGRANELRQHAGAAQEG